jgi:hypothetical protein
MASAEHQQRIVAYALASEAICDLRTARKFLEGGHVVSTMRLRLERAAAKLKIEKWSATSKENGNHGNQRNDGSGDPDAA